MRVLFGNSERCGQSAAKLLSKDEGSRIAANIAKLPDLLRGDRLAVFNHWTTILLTIAAVGGAIVTIYGCAPIRWWRSLKKKVLSFAQNDVFWTIGKLDDQSEPVTLVSGRWRVTNNSNRDVKITNVRLSKYVHQSARFGMRNPEDERNILVYGNFPIAPHQTLEVEVVFTFFSSIGRAPEPIISDVIFTTDNSENQHSVRAKFTYGSKSR